MERSKVLTRVVLITTAVTVAALGIAALIGLATGGFRTGQFGGRGYTVDERKTLPLAGIDTIVIDGVSEDVRIVDGTGDSLEAWLHGTVGAGSATTLPRLITERSGSTLTVRVDRDRQIGFGYFWSNVVLDVGVPKGYAQKISVKTVSGDVKVADHTYAGLALSTTSGDAEVGAVGAQEFSMHTTSGTMKAASVSADRSDFSSTSGDVRVQSLTGDATLHTTSGDMTVAFAASPSRVDASSTSGQVTLRMPSNAQFVLDAHSTSGDISCRFPITISQSATGGGRHALAGTVGGPGGTPGQVAVRTVSGDIHIED